jgi:hypothetical protein
MQNRAKGLVRIKFHNGFLRVQQFPKLTNSKDNFEKISRAATATSLSLLFKCQKGTDFTDMFSEEI